MVIVKRLFLSATAIVALLFAGVDEASASRPIHQYEGAGESGVFRYSVFNNRWLGPSLAGKERPKTEAKLISITGILPGAKSDLIIPETLDGHLVFGIDERAFSSATGIRRIAIPKTVRFLKPGTFGSCKGLEAIAVDPDHPDYASVDGVLFDKKKTTLLALGRGRTGHYTVADGVVAIGEAAFSHCVGLTRVTIPQGVTDVGGRRGETFLGCVALEQVDLPNSVTNVGQKSFQDCKSLERLVLPDQVKAVPFGLFWRCGKLSSVHLPDGVVSIGNYAFADCTQLSMAALPGELKEVGAYAFKNCRGIQKLAVPDGAKLGRGAFVGTGVGAE
jgi:hypothetical protein